MPERRRESRREDFFPVRIDSARKPDRLGVVRNSSSSGLLIGTPSRFEVGDEVDLTFSPRLGDPPRRCRARVVRVALDPEADLFYRLVAVQLETHQAA